MRGKIIKYLVVFAGAVVLAAVTALLLLRFFFPAEQLRELVESRIGSLTGRECSVGSVGFSFFPALAVEMNDIVIAEDPGYSNPNFCRIEAFYLELKWLPLLSGRIVIDRLTIERPEVYLVQKKSDLLNISSLFPADTTGTAADSAGITDQEKPAFSMAFNSIAVSDGVFHYISEKEASEFTISPFDLGVSFKNEPGDSLLSLELEAEIGGVGPGTSGIIAAVFRDGPLRLSCRGIYKPGSRQMDCRVIRAECAGLEIEGKGLFSQVEGNPYEALLKISLDLDRLPLHEGLVAEGRVEGELALKGTLSEFDKSSVEGALSGREVALDGGKLPEKIKIPRIKLDFKGRDLDRLAMELAAGSSAFKLDGSLKNYAALFDSSPTGKGPVAKWQVKIAGPSLKLADFLPRDTGEQSRAEPSEKPPVARKKYPAGDGLLELGRLFVTDNLILENVKMKFRMNNNVLYLNPVEAGVYSGKLAAKGLVRFPGKGPLRSVFDVDINRVEVGEMLKPYTKFGSYIQGKISSQAHLEGTGSETRQILDGLTARAVYSVAEGRLQDWPALKQVAAFTKIEELDPMIFQDWDGVLRIEDGRVYTDSVAIRTPQAFWDLDGSCGFDGSLAYSVRLTLNEALSGKYKAKLPGNVSYFLQNDQERLSLAFKVAGTTDKPSVKWDTRPLVKKAVQKIERKVTGQLDKLVNKLFGRKSSPGKQPSDSSAADTSANP
jgi:AsmA family/AsmA-like C-terminal region